MKDQNPSLAFSLKYIAVRCNIILQWKLKWPLTFLPYNVTFTGLLKAFAEMHGFFVGGLRPHAFPPL